MKKNTMKKLLAASLSLSLALLQQRGRGRL